MTKQEFIRIYLSDASEAGGKYQINPIVILAQAAIESGWGESVLAREHNNLFGITGYGPKNEYLHGGKWNSARADSVSANTVRHAKASSTSPV